MARRTASYPLVVGGSAVSGVGAFLSSLTVGQASSYTVVFNTSVTGALNGPADTITVTFPAGTFIPVAYTPGSVTVNANPAITVVKLSTTQVQVTMPTVSPVTNVVLVFQTSYGILNTTVAGAYSVYVATSLDLMPVASNSFTLAGSSLTNLSVTVTPLTPSSVAQFSISFLTSSPATGVKSGDTIKVEFPAGTQFPSGSFCPACFVINGQTSADQRLLAVSNVVTITVPTTLSIAQQFVSLQISTTANITNPSSAGVLLAEGVHEPGHHPGLVQPVHTGRQFHWQSGSYRHANLAECLSRTAVHVHDVQLGRSHDGRLHLRPTADCNDCPFDHSRRFGNSERRPGIIGQP